MTWLARPNFSSPAARRIHEAGVAFEASRLGLNRQELKAVEPPPPPSPAVPRAKPRDAIRHAFASGDSNALALTAAMAAFGDNPSAGPVYLYGPTGVGKSHLLSMMGTEAAVAGKSVVDLVVRPGAQFHRLVQTLARVGRQDLYLFDDVQFAPQSLAEALTDGDGGVRIFTADRPPAELSLPERVRSRLGAGMVCAIGMPSEVLRRQIIAHRLEVILADHPHFLVGPDLAAALAARIRQSGREVVAGLNRLLASFVFTGAQPSVLSIDALLSDLVRDPAPRPPTVREIVAKVAAHFNLRPDDLVSQRRTRDIVRPRHVAMYLAKTLTPRSFPEIGRHMGGRDHTTVLHGVRKIEAEMHDPDAPVAADVAALRRQLATLAEVPR